jgi:hypothetical protein
VWFLKEKLVEPRCLSITCHYRLLLKLNENSKKSFFRFDLFDNVVHALCWKNLNLFTFS